MDPISIAALGGTALSSIFGALSENQASALNWAINQANRRDQNKWRQEAMDYAKQIRGEEQLGSTNAAGDRTYFKPGVGWVTELGGRNRALLNQFYGVELPERQSQFARGAERSRTESDVADQLLKQFQGVTRGDPRVIESMLYEASTRGIDDATRDATGAAVSRAMRSGSSNVGKLMDKISQAAMKQRSNAGKDARIQAMDYTDQKYNQERNALTQLYNLFASRAGQDIGMSYDPSGAERSANAQLTTNMQNAQQGASIGANAVGQQGGLYAPYQANNALGNMFGGVGAAFGGYADRSSAAASRDETNDLLRSFITHGGTYDLGAGGIGAGGSIADRVRTLGGGAF